MRNENKTRNEVSLKIAQKNEISFQSGKMLPNKRKTRKKTFNKAKAIQTQSPMRYV